MPYILTTRVDPYRDGGPLAVHTRRAVATVDEARAIIRDHVVSAGVPHGTTADPITNSGGTIGPLPDGTMIEVKRTTWRYLAELGHLTPARIRYVTDPRYGDGSSYAAEIVDAYNAAQGKD